MIGCSVPKISSNRRFGQRDSSEAEACPGASVALKPTEAPFIEHASVAIAALFMNARLSKLFMFSPFLTASAVPEHNKESRPSEKMVCCDGIHRFA
jgi:hypothetical protein